MTKQLDIGVLGADGRMGGAIIRSLAEEPKTSCRDGERLPQLRERCGGDRGAQGVRRKSHLRYSGRPRGLRCFD